MFFLKIKTLMNVSRQLNNNNNKSMTNVYKVWNKYNIYMKTF